MVYLLIINLWCISYAINHDSVTMGSTMMKHLPDFSTIHSTQMFLVLRWGPTNSGVIPVKVQGVQGRGRSATQDTSTTQISRQRGLSSWLLNSGGWRAGLQGLDRRDSSRAM